MIKKLEQDRLNTNRKIVIIDEALILNGNKEKSLNSLKEALIRELDLININIKNEWERMNRDFKLDIQLEDRRYQFNNEDESLKEIQSDILKNDKEKRNLEYNDDKYSKEIKKYYLTEKIKMFFNSNISKLDIKPEDRRYNIKGVYNV